MSLTTERLREIAADAGLPRLADEDLVPVLRRALIERVNSLNLLVQASKFTEDQELYGQSLGDLAADLIDIEEIEG
jgi:hypothetical protein